jgi:hypothetical protein
LDPTGGKLFEAPVGRQLLSEVGQLVGPHVVGVAVAAEVD